MVGLSCACGCGDPVKPGRQYRQGHWAKTPEGRQRRRDDRMGKPASVETRAKMSAAHAGHVVSEKTKAALVLRNKTGWQKEIGHKISKTLMGRTLPPEHVAKIKATRISGPGHMWWRGGTSRYPREWQSAKRQTRKRDGGLCMDCGTGIVVSNHWVHDVHHIDGDKQHCKLDNLITLCRSCHQLAQNHTDTSTIKLRAILTERYGYTYG